MEASDWQSLQSTIFSNEGVLQGGNGKVAPIITELDRHLAQVSEGLKEDLAGAEEAAVQLFPHAHQVNLRSQTMYMSSALR